METRFCSPQIKKLVFEAERENTAIAELFGQGIDIPDLAEVLEALRGRGFAAKVTSERGLAILESVRKLKELEDLAIRELMLDQ